MSSRDATSIFKRLRGIFCIYKPSGLSTQHLLESVRTKLRLELNELPVNERQKQILEKYRLSMGARALPSPMSQIEGGRALPSPHPQLESDYEETDSYYGGCTETELQEVKSLIELKCLDDTPSVEQKTMLGMTPSELQYHPLGNLWKDADFYIKPIDKSLYHHSSGIIPCAIGLKACKSLGTISRSKPIKVYRIKAQLGYTTSDHSDRTRTLRRVKYEHIRQNVMDRVLAGVQAVHYKHQYRLAGLDLRSQEAYDAACQGMIRPSGTGYRHAALYYIKCVLWNPPDFELECHTINENGKYLSELVHNIGVELKCGAVYKSIRRIRYGHFDIDKAIVPEQCGVDGLLQNIEDCREAEVKSLLDRMKQLQSDSVLHNITQHTDLSMISSKH